MMIYCYQYLIQILFNVNQRREIYAVFFMSITGSLGGVLVKK